MSAHTGHNVSKRAMKNWLKTHGEFLAQRAERQKTSSKQAKALEGKGGDDEKSY